MFMPDDACNSQWTSFIVFFKIDLIFRSNFSIFHFAAKFLSTKTKFDDFNNFQKNF